jgi:hypothetical protein
MQITEFIAKYKKILLAAGFILVVIILGYLMYALFFRPTIAPPVVTIPATTTPGGLPVSQPGTGEIIEPTEPGTLPVEGGEDIPVIIDPVARGGLTAVTELNTTASRGATLSGDGSDLQYYDKSDGKFYRIDKNGNVEALADKTFYNVEQITWSPDKNKAILEYPDGANIVYDFQTDRQVTLPQHWKEFDFAPRSNQVVMKSMGLDPENRWLAVSSLDGSEARPIEALGEKDATVYPSWSPNQQTIAMYTEGAGFDRQEVYFVGLHDENFKSMTVEGRDFRHTWSPGGERLLYSVYSSDNDMKPMLWITNAQGDAIGSGRKSLKIETWADKCTFAGDTDVYCAVPENLPSGAGLFPELALTQSDRLYRIDTRTGLKKLVAIPNGDYNMSDLIVSNNGYYLYFTDEKTERLHKVKLK